MISINPEEEYYQCQQIYTHAPNIPLPEAEDLIFANIPTGSWLTRSEIFAITEGDWKYTGMPTLISLLRKGKVRYNMPTLGTRLEWHYYGHQLGWQRTEQEMSV